MNAFKKSCVVLVTIAAFAFAASGEEKAKRQSGPKDSGFEKIKALNGDWTVTQGGGDGGHTGGGVFMRSWCIEEMRWK